MANSSRFLVPEQIESQRLILRMIREDDWSSLHEHYSDPESVRFTSPRAVSENETWYAMARMLGHWQLRGYGPYAVEEKATGQVLGAIGLWYPREWPEPEIMWSLTRRYWGLGFASEAVRAVQAMSRVHIPDISLISVIHRDNAPSIALALAVGAKFEREMPFRGDTWPIYRHPR